jgi:hypothetical protein
MIEIESFNIEIEGNIPITPYSVLKWAGYSDSGLFFTQDSQGI